ncbi:MAG: YfcC family protein [Gemmatimonadota bacterium]
MRARPRFRLRLPDPLVLLVGAVLVAALLTWLLPPGAYERAADPATGREVVVAGSFQPIDAEPVGPFDALVALTRGMTEAGDIIFLVLLVGGAFVVVERTGALHAGIERALRVFGRQDLLMIPLAVILFASGGVLFNMQEEFVGLIPVLLLVTARLGLDPLMAVAMSMGAAMVGSAFSPINPFQVGIAQKLAQLPPLSGGAYRIGFLLVAVAIWSVALMRHARRTRAAGRARAAAGATAAPGATAAAAATAPQGATAAAAATAHAGASADERAPVTGGADVAYHAHTLILLLIPVTFGIYVWGAMTRDWGFHEMSGLFFLMAVTAGLVGRLGLDGTARAYAEGFREMAFAAVLIGVARAIFVVLADGGVIDTIVHGLFQPLDGLPAPVAAVGMMGVQTLIHVPVPSVSGQAVLTLPILVPLSDLLDISRQVTVLAYQYGAGLCELITPTNGALMAVLAAARVDFGRWIRFVLPLWGMLFGLGVVSVVLALALGLQ